MSRVLSEEITTAIKELITVLFGFQENTDQFNHTLKYLTNKLKKSDTMYFSNKRDIDRNIYSMAEKFCFHGFFRQAEALKSTYKLYVGDSLPKAEIMNRLNMVKFLLSMSEAPTKHFLENPEMTVQEPVELVEEIDWAEYLNEGIEKWNPKFEDSSDEESYYSYDDNESKEVLLNNSSESVCPLQIKSSNKLYVMDLKANREELLNTIQHTWYNKEKFCIKPESQLREANIGILWENYLNDQVHGFIDLRRPSFTTEYKVIREILWQFWCPHTSSTIELNGDRVRSKSDITLASVRSYSFYNFMNEFIQYIELLKFFRDFQNTLCHDLSQDNCTISRTYQSYCSCLNSILDPVYKKLCEIEEEVKKQETTYTLLRLASDLNNVFEPIVVLKQIHEEIILNPSLHTSLKCATTLIVRLHETLNFTTNKLVQNLKMAMFLESIRYYLELLESWFTRNVLDDYTNEFIIEQNLTTDDWNIEFVVREAVDESVKQNTFLKIFIEKVLKIGKNISFLRMLEKYDIIGDFEDTIYNEYLKNIFKKLNEFYRSGENNELEILTPKICDIDQIDNNELYIQPVIGDSINTTNPDMEKLENLIDVEDGFLMAAFSSFFSQKGEKTTPKNDSLYERISNLSTTLYPKTNIFENVLSAILDERFTISGLMVKNLLIEEHLLEKQFEFLKRVYLFADDIIFPFYRRLFEKTESSDKNWANDIWLTSHLQDIFIDIYPEFYEKCSVQVRDGWHLCADSLSTCSLINIYYDMQWPLNIIIKQDQIEMYQGIFQFLLVLKWAIHTVNHLVFSDLESRNKSIRKSQKTYKATSHRNKPTAKLIRLKFFLINVLNNLQHFVCGFVFSRNLFKYELEFEKAHDLNSLIDVHESFIKSVWLTIKDLKERTMDKDKEKNVLACVKLLKLMWNDLEFATPDRISACIKMYDEFYKDINPIIYPVYIYDY